MHALTNSLEQAKQLLVTVAAFPDYTPFSEAESVSQLTGILADIHANQQHYQSLLTSYHQLVAQRDLLIDAPTDSINYLLSQLDYHLLKALCKPQSDVGQRLANALRYLSRPGLVDCPADIMQPSRRPKYEHFKRSYASLMGRYTELIQLLRETFPDGHLTIFPVNQFVTIYDKIQQLTLQLEGIESLIILRYNQQVVLYQEVKKRTIAIKNHLKRLTRWQGLQSGNQV